MTWLIVIAAGVISALIGFYCAMWVTYRMAIWKHQREWMKRNQW
jgi:hypothetical protein